MCQLNRFHGKQLDMGRHLLGICLSLGIGTLAQAAGYSDNLDAQALDPFTQYTNAGPVITCGRQPGQHPAGLNIRGADVATLWHGVYHMVFPTTSLADNNKVGRVAMIPHKGPAWGISINKHSAMMTVQTKW